MLAFTFDHHTAEECVTIATSTIDAIDAIYTSQYHRQINRYGATLYLMGSLLVLVCVIAKSDRYPRTSTCAIEAFKKGLRIHNEMSSNYAMARHALRRIHKIIGKTQQFINSFQNLEQARSNNEVLGTEKQDSFNGDYSWIMDLDKDLQMLLPPFDGQTPGMDVFWEHDDEFNSNRMITSI